MTKLWAGCLRNHSSLLRWRQQFSSSLKLPEWLFGPPDPVSSGQWRLFPLVERDWGMKLITHHHSESRIRINAATLALCSMPSWHAEGRYFLHRSVENRTPHLNWYIFQIYYLWFQILDSSMFTCCWMKYNVPKLHAIHKTRFYFFFMSFNIQCIKHCSK